MLLVVKNRGNAKPAAASSNSLQALIDLHVLVN
jgi:hypothetical protein